jgi:hypothetical protein
MPIALAIVGVVVGIALGLRFKVLVLVPAIGLAVIFALTVGLARGARLGSIVPAIVIGWDGGAWGRDTLRRIEGTYSAANTMGMPKKPEPPKPTTWTIYKIAAKQERLGTVEAPAEATAMEKGAAERLMAIRR